MAKGYKVLWLAELAPLAPYEKLRDAVDDLDYAKVLEHGKDWFAYPGRKILVRASVLPKIFSRLGLKALGSDSTVDCPLTEAELTAPFSEYLTMAQAAGKLGISRQAVHERLQRHHFPYVEFGSAIPGAKRTKYFRLVKLEDVG